MEPIRILDVQIVAPTEQLKTQNQPRFHPVLHDKVLTFHSLVTARIECGDWWKTKCMPCSYLVHCSCGPIWLSLGDIVTFEYSALQLLN